MTKLTAAYINNATIPVKPAIPTAIPIIAPIICLNTNKMS